jgi:tRNA wybutosine-synthesizing protein 3
MSRDSFQQRKTDILAKLDKSSKQSWDKPIIQLCEKINSLENYYTTSSCSGRIILMIDQDKKEAGLFLKQYHNLTSFNELKTDLKEISKEYKQQIKFKQEACILHVVCRSLENAQKFYDIAKLAGLKKSGIIFSGKRFVLELNSTEKLEFPVIKNKKILVDKEFLNLIITESNKKLKKGWNKIKKLEKLIDQKYL